MKSKAILGLTLTLVLASLILTIPRALAAPIVVTCDRFGNPKKYNLFYFDENVYVKGYGYIPNDVVNITVVVYRSTWSDQASLVPYVRTNQTTTDGSGNLPITSLGKFPVGLWDVVVDTDQDGKYDEATDALTSFGVVIDNVGGIVVSINKLAILAPYIGVASIAVIGAVVVLIKHRRRKTD